jgi:hypothetical protein
MTFNEIKIVISINIRSFSKEITTLTTFIEITEIIENVPDISDTDIADANNTNIIFENIENTSFKNIIVEPALIRRSIRYRKAIFKIIEANAIAVNIVRIAEAPIISADEEESEKKDYLSKAIIAKITIINEDKLTYEKAMADSEKF